MNEIKQQCLKELNNEKKIFTDLDFDYQEHRFNFPNGPKVTYQLQTMIEMFLSGQKFFYIINYQYFFEDSSYSCQHLILDALQIELFRKNIEIKREGFQLPETSTFMYNFLFEQFFKEETNPFVKALTLELNTFNRMKIKEFIMSINKTVEIGFKMCKPFLIQS